MNRVLFTSLPSFDSSDFRNKCKVVETLGSGTFGNVVLYDTPLGRYVIKESKVTNKSLGYPSDFIAEVDMLIKLRAVKTVVRLEGVWYDKIQKKGLLLLEALDSNLSKWAQNTSFEIRMSQLGNIIRMVGGALAIMHRFSFVHNDVKTNNILVRKTNDGYIFKLCDFGNAMHLTDPNVRYWGIERYRPPIALDTFTNEFWAFMVSLIEVILGGNAMFTKETKAIDFYQPYIRLSHLGKTKFDLPAYLRSVLKPIEYERIPQEFWIFINPLINGEQTNIQECLSNIKYNLDINEINEVDRSISKAVATHSRFNIVENEFRNRMRSIGLGAYFNRFHKLYNKFLSVAQPQLTDEDLKYYAEVAFVIVAQSKAKRFEYFKDQETFLKFQRAFIILLGYQVVII